MCIKYETVRKQFFKRGWVLEFQTKKKMAPVFNYVSTQLFTEKGVQISCLGKTKKAGYFFVSFNFTKTISS